MEKRKRQRGSNFTKEEEMLLLAEVEKYKAVIECKLTDKANTAVKNSAWNKVLVAFNLKNTYRRNVEQIKAKYDNLKTKARKIMAENTQENKPVALVSLNLDPAVEATLRILSKSVVVNYNNPFDSDCLASTNTGDVRDKEDSNLVTVKSEDLSDASVEQDNPEMCSHDDWENTQDINVTNENLQCNKTGNNAEETQKSHRNTPDPLIPEATNQNVHSWRMSKQKNPKLTTTNKWQMRNPRKDEYYKEKIVLVKEKIKEIRMQQDILKKKCEHDVEEHNKKMILLDIEIELQKQVLNKDM